MIDFVGAGPGAADLITVRGMEVLEHADVVVYAGSLVNPEVLGYCREGAELFDSAHMTLEEVAEVLVGAERAGKRACRLHTGDPAMYGAIREQMDILDEAGVAYRVTPGVSSVFAAAAALTCEYTLPGVSQSLVLTRAGGRTGVPSGQELRSFARHGCTIALFLSCGLLEKVRAELIAGGCDPHTPAAIVYRASWPDEKVVRCDVDGLPKAAAREGLDRQAIVVVGEVLAARAGQGGAERSKLYDPAFSHGYRAASVQEAHPAGKMGANSECGGTGRQAAASSEAQATSEGDRPAPGAGARP